MNSTTSHSSPYKLVLIVIGVVVSLHVLTAMALVMVKSQAVPIESNKVKPIDIELIIPPVDIQKVSVVEMNAKPIARPVTDNKMQSHTEALLPDVRTFKKSKPKAQTPKPETLKRPIERKAVKDVPAIEQKIEVQSKPLEKRLHSLKVQEPRRVLAVEEQESALKQAALQKAAEQRASDNAKIQSAIQAQEAIQAKREQEAIAAEAQEVAKRTAEQAAQRQAMREAAAQAASNEPVDFSGSDASWVVSPNLSFPERAKRGARSGDVFTIELLLRVNKQGGIDSVRLTKSSGNTVLDKEAQRQIKSGRFKPFIQNAQPVVGNVALPLTYKMP